MLQFTTPLKGRARSSASHVRVLLFLTGMLFWPAGSLAAQTVTFAFSEHASPYSSKQEGEAVGLLPDIVRLVFEFIPGMEPLAKVLPWARAQYDVQHGRYDGLLTYPSDERRAYALFTDRPVYVQNFGNLVYSDVNPNASIIESATGFDALGGLTVITEKDSGWEADNIPGDLDRVVGKDGDTMMHLLMFRKAGDYMVTTQEGAKFLAAKHGYSAQLRTRSAEFITESLVPFHIGISRSSPGAEQIIKQIESVMDRPMFQLRLEQLISRYR